MDYNYFFIKSNGKGILMIAVYLWLWFIYGNGILMLMVY